MCSAASSGKRLTVCLSSTSLSAPLLGTVDFDSLKEREIDAIQEAIIALPEGDRQKIEADFRDIDALASERGFRAMIDEAAWHVRNNPRQHSEDQDLTQRLANVDGEQERAMWVFLNRQVYWHGAMLVVCRESTLTSQSLCRIAV